ncbi:hypothetical protein WDU94_005640 [Cyamophila willieti]
MKQAETKQRNLNTCFIDYKKAFDSIPHSWLLRVLNIYRVDLKLINLLQALMKTWRTRISIKTTSQNILTEVVNIKRGIFQGDSLSALWFCIALNPLSNTLNRTDIGFKIKQQSTINHTVNHLMYMDDIKLYAETKDQLNNLIRVTEYFSRDIHMEFGIEKCKIQTVERGKWSQSDAYTTIDQEVITGMSSEETYKYLGYQQHTQLNTKKIKEILEHSFHQRLKLILKSQVNSKNMVKAINTYAVPILIYSFGVIRWSNTELEKLNRTIRVSLTQHRSHHPNACIERINTSRKKGGRGFIDLYDLHHRQIRNLREYFHSKQDSALHHSIIKADINFTPLNLSLEEMSIPETKEIERERINRWKSKELHSRHPHQVEKENISIDLTYKWLDKGEIYPETEGFILAAQDQVLLTNNYKKYIMKNGNTSDKCRRCCIQSETVAHIVSGCKMLAGTAYTERHDSVGKIIHQKLALDHNLINDYTPYYQYVPKTVLENQHYKIYWDNPIQTDKTIIANRPDIVLVNKGTKETFLIDVAIPNDNNVECKYNEKMKKYLELAIEIKRVWNQNKVYIIPFIISATGITPKSFKNSLVKLNLPEDIHTKAQKAVIIKTASILRKFLNT